jgi:hypothetical protein
MPSTDASIRPNSIGFPEAARLVHQRVRHAAGECDPPEDSGEARALEALWEGSASERRELLQQVTRQTMLQGLLAGSLRAHFSDDADAKDIPGWAWVGAQGQWHVWTIGRLVMGALMRDEWQRWSGDPVFLDRGAFEAWVAEQDFAASGAGKLPQPFDLSEMPALVESLVPPERPFVTLSQALSWIAFGVSLENERLIRAIDECAFGPSLDISGKLEKAAADLATLALGGQLEIRGKYLVDSGADDSAVLTEIIDPIRFHDFAQFDIHLDGLRYGTGLTWMKSESIGDILMSKRADSIQSVALSRADLLKHFPLRTSALDAPASSSVDSPIGWSDFEAASIPELHRLHELALRDEWWTWPEAIAWVGSRDSRNLATLRYWAIWWTAHGDSDPTVTVSAQGSIASRYCLSAEQSKLDLLNAIERGAVSTAGRADRNAKSAPLARGDWRGGTVVYSDGAAQLVSAKNPLTTWASDIAVNRADLVKAFPPEEKPGRSKGGEVPPNRQLDHDAIFDRVIAMRVERPALSKGSAAASIVAELPPNPRTGKPRDARYIEKLIAHLWEGAS